MKYIISPKLLLIIFLCQSIYSQNSLRENLKKNPNINNPGHNNSTKVENYPARVSSALVTRDGEIKQFDLDLTEEMDIIIEFKEEPLYLQSKRKSVKASNISFYESRFQKFSTDLNMIYQSLSKKTFSIISSIQIKKEFYKIFFGVNVIAVRGALSSIQSLPYVKKIHMNKEFKTTLDESVPIIRADSVWVQYDTQGDNIVVAILDSGIDYMHPALGGGYGEGYKVIGGYDLVNEDNDPMDDFGHGTHVAGIVAADGDNIKGVAPKALLMAIKVLNSYGQGWETRIIEGIELAVDKNVDIINMSLSGNGNPDDAVSTAVDNATELGIAFCISAGNYGLTTLPIGSPATARSAITVGATNKNDNIANFSSKGPNPKIYSIKPEVVAPGVDINSTFSNDGYAVKSGTSMSAPHVAGVCALLKSIHPDWTPAILKSALMTSAIDIGEEVMTQGAGRVDALSAAEVSTFSIPSHLSFGLDDLRLQQWSKSDTLLVINQFTELQSFSVDANGIQNGMTLSAVPDNFILAQNDSQYVIFSLTVDNSILPNANEKPYAFSGRVQINGDRDTLKLPWAFIKTPKVTLTFNLPRPNFIISSDNFSAGTLNADWIDLYTAELLLPEGVYDIFATSHDEDSKIVIYENIAINDFMIYSIDFKDAIYQIELNGVDETGQLLSSADYYFGNIIIGFPESSKFSVFIRKSPPSTINISEFSNRFTIVCGEFQHRLEIDENIYVVQHEPILGINDNINLTNSPSDYIMQNLILSFPPQSTSREIIFTNSHMITTEEFLWIQGSYFGRYFSNSNEWHGKLFMTADTHPNFGFTTQLIVNDRNILSDNYLGHFITTDPFRNINDSITCFLGFTSTLTDYISPSGGTMSFGNGPIFIRSQYTNNLYGESNIALSSGFLGSLKEKRPSDVNRSYYKIYNESNQPIVENELNNFKPLDVVPDRYKVEIINSDYYIEGYRGHAQLNSYFDLRLDDAVPPEITHLRLYNSENISVGKLKRGESATLSFSVADYKLVVEEEDYYFEYQYTLISDSTKLFYKVHGTNIWEKLSVSYIIENPDFGLLFASDLTETTNFDSAAIDLKVIFEDLSGNTTEWILEPAFAIGNFKGVVNIEEELKIEDSIPLAYKLYNNHPNPFNPSTTISYSIPEKGRIILKVFDVLGKEVAILVNEIKTAGEYNVVFDGSYLSSGVYFYTININDYRATKKMLLIK